MSSSAQHLRLIISTLFFASGCGGADDSPGPTGPPSPVATSIMVSTTSVILDTIGKTTQLSATVKDQNGEAMSGKTITWATSNAAIIAVSTSGLVTAIAPGMANISATHQSISATASVIARNGTIPIVLMLTYDGSEVVFQPGVVELGGSSEIAVFLWDDQQLKKIAIYLHTNGQDVELVSDESLTGTEATYTFDWNTYETTTVGGIDTLVVRVWDASDNEGIGGQEIVLMHQPLVMITNYLARPVVATFFNQALTLYEPDMEVFPQSIGELRYAFMSTDTISLTWKMQRAVHPDSSSLPFGEPMAATFAGQAPDSALVYEIDNVLGGKTFYYPEFSNHTREVLFPYIDVDQVGEIDICWVPNHWDCWLAPVASYEERVGFGYYELKTTSMVAYRRLLSSGPGPDMSEYYGGWPAYGSWNSFAPAMQAGSGIVHFPIFGGGCAGNPACSVVPGQGRKLLANSFIEELRRPSLPRMPGAITDDQPLSRE